MDNQAKVIVLDTHNNNFPNYTILRYGDIFGGKASYTYEECAIRTPHQQCHMYLISDEEIKVGDWAYNENALPNEPEIHQCVIIDNCKSVCCKKVVASTDPSLNLPGISKAFIKAWCVNQVDSLSYYIDKNMASVVVWSGAKPALTIAELETHLREIRTKLVNEFESPRTDYIPSKYINAEIKGIDHALSYIAKNK